MSNPLKPCLLGLFLAFVLPLYPQVEISKNSCGTEVPSPAWNAEFQKMVEQFKASNTAGKSQQQNNYVIPVIFHIIHGGQAVGTYPNLPQGQVNSQVYVLNDDYAGIGYNSSTYPQTAFTTWASNMLIPQTNLDALGRIAIADCGVQFVLATMDTLGNMLPEPGIDRVNYVTKGWANPNSYNTSASFKNFIDNTVKPQTIWTVSKYMNVWVTDSDQNGTGGLLGYATFPALAGLGGLPGGTGTSTTDGFWCYARCLGSASTYPGGNYLNGYNRGRTSTHEIGHWLGLRHIWGDGNCSATDYCADTPPASASNFNAPTYPLKTNVCSGNVNGEMYMNFMDYTNDPIKYMFTGDQATRIQTALSNSPYRKDLGTHGLAGMAATASFQNSILNCPGVPITLVNTSMGFPIPIYTWSSSGPATFSPNANVASPTVIFSAPGIYSITLTAYNGTTSISTKTFNVQSPAVSLSASSQTICNGSSVVLGASGVVSYTWEPGSVANYSVSYSPTQAQTYTCNAKQINGCLTTTMISIAVAECTDINQLQSAQQSFNIYPNPAKEVLNIEFDTEKAMQVSAEVIDALGKTVSRHDMIFSREKQRQSVNVSALPDGVYFVKLNHSNGAPQVTKLVKE